MVPCSCHANSQQFSAMFCSRLRSKLRVWNTKVHIEQQGIDKCGMYVDNTILCWLKLMWAEHTHIATNLYVIYFGKLNSFMVCRGNSCDSIKGYKLKPARLFVRKFICCLVTNKTNKRKIAPLSSFITENRASISTDFRLWKTTSQSKLNLILSFNCNRRSPNTSERIHNY